MSSRLLEEARRRLFDSHVPHVEHLPTVDDRLIEHLSDVFPDLPPVLTEGSTMEDTYQAVAIQQGRRDVIEYLRAVRKHQRP